MQRHLAVAGSALKWGSRSYERSPADAGIIALIYRCGTLAALVMLSACGETLFQSNFDQTPVNQPPSPVQQVGTATVFAPAGTVIVVPSPVTPSGKWVQILHPPPPQVAVLQGNFSQQRGAGTYTLSTVLYVPSGAGAASISLDHFGQQASDFTSFLHIDFMEDNRVRIDDNPATEFGSFPRDQAFIVQVTLNATTPTPTAHIALSGAGASGQMDYPILPPFRAFALDFGAVRLWKGLGATGSFDATNIVVTRATQ